MNSLKNFILSLSVYKKLAIGIFAIISFIFISTALIALNIANKQTTTIVEELIDSNIKSNREFIISTLLAGDSWKLFKFLKSLTQNSTIQEAGLIDKNKKIIAHSMPKKYRIGDNFNSLENRKIIPLDYNGINLGSIVLKVENSSINQMIKDVFLQNAFFLLAAAIFSFFIASISMKKFLNRFKIILSNMNAISQKKWDDIQNNPSLEKDEISSLTEQSITVMEEIKESIKKEESLRVFYRDILKSIDSFIVICDNKMNIKYHNNHYLSTLLLEETKSSFLKNLLETIESDAKIHNSFTLEVNDDEVVHLLVNIQYLEENTVIYFSNITKLKEIEENKKIVHSLQLLGEISSQFAHEIKNLIQPLTLLIPKKELPDKEDLPMIHNTLGKMKEQISDFLVIGKPLEIDENIEIFLEQNNKETIFKISNKGDTIEDTKKIFKPFYTTKQEGSGLGLFTIYKIIHTIKGRVEVQSFDNQTSFTIFIPNRIEQ